MLPVVSGQHLPTPHTKHVSTNTSATSFSARCPPASNSCKVYLAASGGRQEGRHMLVRALACAWWPHANQTQPLSPTLPPFAFFRHFALLPLLTLDHARPPQPPPTATPAPPIPLPLSSASHLSSPPPINRKQFQTFTPQ